MNTEDLCVRVLGYESRDTSLGIRVLGYESWEVYKRRRPSEMKTGSNRFRHVGLMNKEEIVRVDYGSPQMVAALSLRKEVFVDEQGVPAGLEFDKDDQSATHLVTLVDGQVVGTLRITACGRAARIGRVAVRTAFRRAGIGSRLMERAARMISESGGREILLHAQLPIVDFYRDLGYSEEGDVSYEAGIPHVWMRKKLQSRQLW